MSNTSKSKSKSSSVPLLYKKDNVHALSNAIDTEVITIQIPINGSNSVQMIMLMTKIRVADDGESQQSLTSVSCLNKQKNRIEWHRNCTLDNDTNRFTFTSNLTRQQSLLKHHWKIIFLHNIIDNVVFQVRSNHYNAYKQKE